VFARGGLVHVPPGGANALRGPDAAVGSDPIGRISQRAAEHETRPLRRRLRTHHRTVGSRRDALDQALVSNARREHAMYRGDQSALLGLQRRRSVVDGASGKISHFVGWGRGCGPGGTFGQLSRSFGCSTARGSASAAQSATRATWWLALPAVAAVSHRRHSSGHANPTRVEKP
jgi:hypothetical protein